MDKKVFADIRERAHADLERCNEFWLKHGADKIHGGIYTYLDREGKVYSTDKSVWMQGRCGWTYARLCALYGARDEWLAMCGSCLDFMEAYCINRSAGDRMYFTVTEDGKPLRQRRYCMSEGFYAIANAEYYGVTGRKECLDRAFRAYELVYALTRGKMKDPTGLGPKTIPETRSMRSMGSELGYLYTTSVLRRADPARRKLYDERAAECIANIFRYNFRPELGCTLENIGIDGEFMSDIGSGRIVNPGHDVECSWIAAEHALLTGNTEIFGKCVRMFDMAMETGWDKEYGGIYTFVDCMGRPPECFEHDMKLWWPHNEALIASLLIYRETGEQKYFDWFRRLMDYCEEHFRDDVYGEWYGYLRRDGKPSEPIAKGGVFKGPFHVQRSLMEIERMAAQLESRRE